LGALSHECFFIDKVSEKGMFTYFFGQKMVFWEQINTGGI